MLRILKKFLLAVLSVLIVGMFPIHIMRIGIKGTSYVEKKVTFDFSQTPQCLYAFDRFSQGKDYDKLTIYKIESNIAEFEKHLQDSGWFLLPLTDNIRNHQLCSLSFDTNMIDMLSCSNGYWRWDEKFNELIIYDADEHTIYIRNASVLY